MKQQQIDDTELVLKVEKESQTGLFNNERLLLIKAGYISYFSKVPKGFVGNVRSLELSGQLPKFTLCISDIQKVKVEGKHLIIKFKENLIDRNSLGSMIATQNQIKNFPNKDIQKKTWNFICESQSFARIAFETIAIFRQDSHLKPSLRDFLGGFKQAGRGSRQMSMLPGAFKNTPYQNHMSKQTQIQKKRLSQINTSSTVSKSLFQPQKAKQHTVQPTSLPDDILQSINKRKQLKKNSIQAVSQRAQFQQDDMEKISHFPNNLTKQKAFNNNQVSKSPQTSSVTPYFSGPNQSESNPNFQSMASNWGGFIAQSNDKAIEEDVDQPFSNVITKNRQKQQQNKKELNFLTEITQQSKQLNKMGSKKTLKTPLDLLRGSTTASKRILERLKVQQYIYQAPSNKQKDSTVQKQQKQKTTNSMTKTTQKGVQNINDEQMTKTPLGKLHGSTVKSNRILQKLNIQQFIYSPNQSRQKVQSTKSIQQNKALKNIKEQVQIDKQKQKVTLVQSKIINVKDEQKQLNSLGLNKVHLIESVNQANEINNSLEESKQNKKQSQNSYKTLQTEQIQIGSVKQVKESNRSMEESNKNKNQGYVQKSKQSIQTAEYKSPVISQSKLKQVIPQLGFQASNIKIQENKVDCITQIIKQNLVKESKRNQITEKNGIILPSLQKQKTVEAKIYQSKNIKIKQTLTKQKQICLKKDNPKLITHQFKKLIYPSQQDIYGLVSGWQTKVPPLIEKQFQQIKKINFQLQQCLTEFVNQIDNKKNIQASITISVNSNKYKVRFKENTFDDVDSLFYHIFCLYQALAKKIQKSKKVSNRFAIVKVIYLRYKQIQGIAVEDVKGQKTDKLQKDKLLCGQLKYFLKTLEEDIPGLTLNMIKVHYQGSTNILSIDQSTISIIRSLVNIKSLALLRDTSKMQGQNCIHCQYSLQPQQILKSDPKYSQIKGQIRRKMIQFLQKRHLKLQSQEIEQFISILSTDQQTKKNIQLAKYFISEMFGCVRQQKQWRFQGYAFYAGIVGRMITESYDMFNKYLNNYKISEAKSVLSWQISKINSDNNLNHIDHFIQVCIKVCEVILSEGKFQTTISLCKKLLKTIPQYHIQRLRVFMIIMTSYYKLQLDSQIRECFKQANTFIIKLFGQKSIAFIPIYRTYALHLSKHEKTILQAQKVYLQCLQFNQQCSGSIHIDLVYFYLDNHETSIAADHARKAYQLLKNTLRQSEALLCVIKTGQLKDYKSVIKCLKVFTQRGDTNKIMDCYKIITQIIEIQDEEDYFYENEHLEQIFQLLKKAKRICMCKVFDNFLDDQLGKLPIAVKKVAQKTLNN